MHQCINFPKKWEKVESPPKKKGGKQLKKRNIYLTILKKKVETNSHRKIPRYGSMMPPCHLVNSCSLPRSFHALFLKLFLLGGHLARNISSWVLEILQQSEKRQPLELNGIEVFLISVLHHLRGILGHLWRSLNSEMLQFWQWKVALLTWRQPTRFKGFFQHGQAAFPRQILQILISASTKKNVQGRIWIVSNPPWEWHSWNSGCTHPWL